MKILSISTAWRIATLLCGLLIGSSHASEAQIVKGTIKQASGTNPAGTANNPKNGVDVFYLPDFSNTSTQRYFSGINVTISIPAVTPIPTAVITPYSTLGTGIIMVPNSVAQGGNPVLYNGRLYYMWVLGNNALTGPTFTAGTEVKAFNITFTGGPGTQQVQLNDNQVSNSGLGQLGQAQFYVEMSGVGQVSPDPTSGQDPFYNVTGASTHGTAVHPASASNPTVSPGGTDYQAMTVQAVPLPVQLTTFTATKKAADGLLNWTTASEVNSDYFEVQASPDGTTWQLLGKVAAAGNSTTSRDYSYLDKTIVRYGAPVVYYRLRQVDLDGTATFSPVRTLTPDAIATEWSVGAYPNPYARELSAQLITPEAGPVTVTMYDVAGRVVLRQQTTAAPGTQLIDLREAADVATGTYVLRVQQGTHTGTVLITKE